FTTSTLLKSHYRGLLRTMSSELESLVWFQASGFSYIIHAETSLELLLDILLLPYAVEVLHIWVVSYPPGLDVEGKNSHIYTFRFSSTVLPRHRNPSLECCREHKYKKHACIDNVPKKYLSVCGSCGEHGKPKKLTFLK
ncbi:hypothetical protein STEG23_019456, partial [Scotinomys teguina]